MERLLRKFETAKSLVPQPVVRKAAKPTRFGVIYFGSTSPAMDEALAALEADGIHLDAMRVRAFPFADAVFDFITRTTRVRRRAEPRRADALAAGQRCGIDPARLVSVLHYDGTPITARFIARRSPRTHRAPRRRQRRSRARKAS
jgi:2-oxoglutarate ferredoxin oxidoreductase subunit alpha